MTRLIRFNRLLVTGSSLSRRFVTDAGGPRGTARAGGPKGNPGP
jgi:hypothetical protein